MSEAAATEVGNTPLEALVANVRQGERRSVARMISLVESTGKAGREAVAEIHRHAGRAHVIGLTGVPGSGKSTMARAMTQRLREKGKTVGIVAVDPSSPFTGGAILGDRIRMTDLAGDEGVFIRSMGTRGALGGLARATLDVVDVLDVAGFDVVLIETVGVGQDEVDVVQAAQTVVVVSAPGLGDEVQAIKAGVLEIADIHVVSKCDRADALRTVENLRMMLKLGAINREPSAWEIPVLPTSAQNREGIEGLVDTVLDHRRHLNESGEMESRRRKIVEMRVLKAAEDIIRERLLGGTNRANLEALLARALKREVDPYGAARLLIGGSDAAAGRTG